MIALPAPDPPRIGHVKAGGAFCDGRVERQYPTDEGGEHVAIQPCPQNRALFRVPARQQSNAQFQRQNRDGGNE